MNNIAIADSDKFDAGLFDNLKRFDEHDWEYWRARDLMIALGYKSWQKFSQVIAIAIENLETTDLTILEHFLPVEIINTDSEGNRLKGRTGLDYKLSRLACYHIALCCDSRGNESVKMAKHYFVVKTRQAEVVVPAQNEQILALALVNENMKMQLAWADKQDNRIALHGLPIALLLEGKSGAIVEVEKPTIEVIDDRHNIRFKGQTLKQLAEYLQRKTGIYFKSGADLKRALEKIGRGDLISQTVRSVPSDYIPEEFINEAIQVLSRGDRQKLIGE